MPLSLEQFLEQEPTLADIRRELATADRATRRRRQGEERDLVQMLSRQWELGTVGWMSRAEATFVALELTDQAVARGLPATAAVVELTCAGQSLPSLVFTGGPHGPHSLPLKATSPVRAQLHWAGYLEQCGAVAHRDIKPENSAQPIVVRQPLRLRLLGALWQLLRPGRRAPAERARMLSVPQPRKPGP